jgi:PIN domain nuclease of toxin-antitoxin system
VDTNVFIWATTDDIRLSPKARNLILAASEVYVSAVSIWEIAIKSSLGKIAAEAEEMLRAIIASGFRECRCARRMPPLLNQIPSQDTKGEN